jgi:hypothetical protein
MTFNKKGEKRRARRERYSRLAGRINQHGHVKTNRADIFPNSGAGRQILFRSVGQMCLSLRENSYGMTLPTYLSLRECISFIAVFLIVSNREYFNDL